VSGRPLPLALYAAASALFEPLAPALLRGRARRGKENAARLAERLGRSATPRPPGPLAWLHGVSVGESLSLLPLIGGLQARRPDLNLLVTSGTVTSAELLAKRLPPGVIHQFAPVDGPAAVRRFLDHWRPDVGLQVESELWPNLILAARMTEQSAQGWARAPASARAVLGAFEAVLPQDGDTEARLRTLGAAIGPRLNLKLVGEPPPFDADELRRLKAQVGARKVVLAASTHPGEEPIVARAFQAAALGDALLIVVPRHPDRGPAVAQALRDLGLAVRRRGEGEPIEAGTTAYVADTLGELGLFLRLADVAVMGGSFVPEIGGHNPMEPARLGVPVVTGPHAFNAREIYDEMFALVAALEAADEPALARHLAVLMTYPHIARRVGEAGIGYAERQGAALQTALDRIEPLLPA